MRAAWQAILHGVYTVANRVDPSLKVFGNQLVSWPVFRVNLQRQPPQGAAVLATGSQDAAAIALQNGEDALQRLVALGKCGIDYHRPQRVEVSFQHRAQKSFLAFKEVVEAAGVDLRVGQQVSHAGAGESALPEEMAGRVD